MMLTHCGNNVRNRYSGCVFSVKDIVPVPLKTSRNRNRPWHDIPFVPVILAPFGSDWNGAKISRK